MLFPYQRLAHQAAQEQPLQQPQQRRRRLPQQVPTAQAACLFLQLLQMQGQALLQLLRQMQWWSQERLVPVVSGLHGCYRH